MFLGEVTSAVTNQVIYLLAALQVIIVYESRVTSFVSRRTSAPSGHIDLL